MAAGETCSGQGLASTWNVGCGQGWLGNLHSRRLPTQHTGNGAPLGIRVPLNWGKACHRRWESHGCCGQSSFQNAVCHGPATQPPHVLGSTAGFLDPSWGSGLLFPCASLPSLSLDQDELELVLKGSYEDKQTSALGTASAFCFHYMAAQEAELSGCLKVGLGSGATCQPQPWASSSCCRLLSGHPPAKVRSLWPYRPPPVRHYALGTQGEWPRA